MSFGFGKALDVMRMGTAVRRGTWAPEFALIMAMSRLYPIDEARPLGRAIPWLVGRDVEFSTTLVLIDAREETVAATAAALDSDDLLAEDWDYVR